LITGHIAQASSRPGDQPGRFVSKNKIQVDGQSMPLTIVKSIDRRSTAQNLKN